MEKEYYSLITERVAKHLFEKGFSMQNEGGFDYYADNQRAFMLEYDEESCLLHLKNAVLQEGQGVSFKSISAWSFDVNFNDKDKESIANDFIDTIDANLGIKASAVSGIDMPTKRKNADTIDMESMTARFLSMFPAYKEDYKQHVLTYGEFLQDDFFGKNGVYEFKRLVSEGNKKTVNKYLDLLSECFINGDESVSTTVVFTICTGALLESPDLYDRAFELFEKFPYLKKAVFNMHKLLKNEKNRTKYCNV